MSTSVKWILTIIVLAGAGWFLWSSGWLNPPAAPATQTSTATNAVPDSSNGMSVPTDNSDAALAQDTAAVDAQMQGLTSDSAQVDQSMNDKPVEQ